MAQQGSLVLGVACLLLLAAAVDAVQTTGSVNVKLVFEKMSLDTFEKKYQSGAATAIAASAGVPTDYVSYKGAPQDAAATGSPDAIANFAIRTTDEPWGEQSTVRRKLLASAAGSGVMFYSHLAKNGVPFKPAVFVNDIEILGGSQAGAWDTPKSRFTNNSSSNDNGAGSAEKNQVYLTPQELAVLNSKANDSSSNTTGTPTAEPAAAAPAAAAAAPAASSGNVHSGPTMYGALPLAAFIPIVVIGSLLGLLALTALAVSLYRLCRACGCCGKEEDGTDEEAAPVDGTGVVCSGSEDEGYVSASPNSVVGAKGYCDAAYQTQQHS